MLSGAKSAFGGKKIVLGTMVLVAVLGIAAPVAASMLIPAADKAKEKAKAPDNSPVINENWELERIDFIHYAKPEHPGKAPKAPSCYKLIGPKWRSLPVTYVINPRFISEKNPSGLDEEFVKDAVLVSAETWDGVTSTELFNDTYKINYITNQTIQ